MVSQLKLSPNNRQLWDDTDDKENEFDGLPIQSCKELKKLNENLKMDASFKKRFVSSFFF